MKLWILKEEGMILLTTSIKKQWLFLLLVLLTSGCSELHRYSAPALSLPEHGNGINERFKIGDTFPSFTAIDSEGVPYLVDESKYGDRYTMIVFWRADPTFCEVDIPRFISLYERFERQGFEIISIDLNDVSDASQAMASRPLVPWTSLYDNPENSLVDEFKLQPSQSIFLLDGDGTIVSAHPYMNSADFSIDTWTGESRTVHATDWTISKLFSNDST